MSESPIHANAASFCTMFTRAVIQWNNAEDAARQILEGLSNGGLGSTIAIRQLGNASLKDAILIVVEFLESMEAPAAHEQAAHLKHFVEGFDILRVYRNFYVHNIRAMGESLIDSDKFVGVLHAIEVKPKYAWVQQDLTNAELRSFTQSTMELAHYGGEIANVVKPKNALAQLAGLKPKPLSSLQKPTWPQKLKKNRENLLRPTLPPPPSPE